MCHFAYGFPPGYRRLSIELPLATINVGTSAAPIPCLASLKDHIVNVGTCYIKSYITEINIEGFQNITDNKTDDKSNNDTDN